MHSTQRPATPPKGRFGRFLGDRSGAMAVEFALVVAPLLFMLFSIIELALVFVLTSSLENATTDIARTVRTGALQGTGTATAVGFRNSICAKLGWLQSQCQTSLDVDVRVFSEFSTPPISDLVSSSGVFDKSKLKFDLGGPGDIVLVRSFYSWKLVTPFLPMGGLQSLNNGNKQILAAATFRNEPF